ncbi:uncharacterized protein LOC142974889 [Anticarsia gemmatalis]|uniref:uncharacterized protein LOC142974889 n=1 Tax=Anticarsia gemmatalis TaxID=129554 RepID=UPI003F76553E
MNKCAVVFCGILLILKYNTALEYNRQRLSANTDFLLHEGGQTNVPKRDNVATNAFGSNGQSFNNNQNGDYAAQFPALGPVVTPKSTTTTGVWNNHGQQQSNGKRDYVAPQFPTLKPVQNNSPVTSKPTATTVVNNNNAGAQHNAQQSGGRRDYVAPQYPALKPVHNNVPATPKPTTTVTNAWHHQNPQSSNGKRDYVAPQFPTLKPVHNNQPAPNNQPSQNNQATGGKVKDLVNFYDSKNPNQGPPSYSTILQGPNKNGPSSTTRVTQATPSPPATPTKPMSFSSIVAGQKPNAGAQMPTTAKPGTNAPNSPGSRPGTPVLPSTIVNNNRGTNSNGNTVTDAELQTLSEELLRKDTNNAARYITINYQEKTTSQSSQDKAPLPLLTVSPEAWNIPTIQKFVPLLDNYERDVTVNEHVTPQERIEENAFMDAIMSTTVMRHLMTFLKNKGYVTPDPKQQRDFVKQMWFNLYSRGKGKIGSSGFEHTFVSELKNGGVSGLHNWVYFSREEAANRANYLGWMKHVELGDKGAVLKYHFSQQGVDKPVNTMFLGTSPELEMALYTLCYVTRVDNDCKLKLSNNDVNIVTYNYRYRSKNLVGSAFPQI